jgi:hypothetical protein
MWTKQACLRQIIKVFVWPGRLAAGEILIRFRAAFPPCEHLVINKQ